jgi:hypothetical protein
MTTPAPTTARRRIVPMTLVGLATLVAASVPLWSTMQSGWTREWLLFAALYSTILVAAGLLAFRRSTGAQLLARSIWWSAFGGGALVALFAAQDRGVARVALVMLLATGTALLAAGRPGVDHASADDFAPAAYRTPIIVSMIMALADAQALGWLGASRLYAVLQHYAGSSASREIQQSSVMLACSGLALIALYGLYKLRLWGLVLSALTTLAIGILAFTPATGMSDAGPIPYAFALSAAIQIALLAPLFLAIVQRRAPAPPSPRVARLAAIAPNAVIIALAALSVLTVATSHSLIRF